MSKFFFSLPGLLLFAFSIALFSSENAVASDVGKRFPSEKREWTDPITRRTLTVLTASDFSDIKPYQTHETWTSDGDWVLFRSNRAARGGQFFAVNEQSGEIVQLTDAPGVNTGLPSLSRKEMKLYYMRNGVFQRQSDDPVAKKEPVREIIALDLAPLLADALNDRPGDPAGYERRVAVLPSLGDAVGFSLDADETRLYLGNIVSRPPETKKEKTADETREEARVRFEEAGQGKSRILGIDISTGKITDVVAIDFRIGHIQANPWVPGEIAFCHETGGDAPQRIWSVKADGSEYRPLYVETPDEWVTHEAYSGPDEMMFILSGGPAYLWEKPTGIGVVNLRTKRMELLGQTDERSGGFWHCQGTPDGAWAVGDTSSGSVYLINRATGERTQLTAGHSMRPDHLHPIFSRDGSRVLVQSSILSGGKSTNLMTISLDKPSAKE